MSALLSALVQNSHASFTSIHHNPAHTAAPATNISSGTNCRAPAPIHSKKKTPYLSTAPILGQCYWLPAVRPMLFVSKSASFSAPQIITQKLQAYKLGLLFFFFLKYQRKISFIDLLLCVKFLQFIPNNGQDIGLWINPVCQLRRL